MQAVVYERYGPPEVLQLRDVPKLAPKDDELLIKVHATTVRAGDWRMRKPDPAMARLFNGLFRPRRRRILGMELAGEVASVGKKVTLFRLGDRVFGSTALRFGGYAQYACLPEDAAIAVMHDNLTWEEAAAAPSGGIAALVLLRKAGLRSGQHALVYGASGSVGSFALQIAAAMGAEVTGVCSTANVDWVRDLGAVEVVDYTQEDFTQRDVRYDLIFDTVGKMMSGLPKSHFARALKPGGAVVSIEDGYKESAEALAALAELMEAGSVRSVIDRTYALADMVEAHRYVEQGHKKGNVVVTVPQGD